MKKKLVSLHHTVFPKAPWNDPEVRWVCEEHPTEDMEHKVWVLWPFFKKECGGPGMVERTEENRAKGYLV